MKIEDLQAKIQNINIGDRVDIKNTEEDLMMRSQRNKGENAFLKSKL
jgi:hypothetical protein